MKKLHTLIYTTSIFFLACFHLQAQDQGIEPEQEIGRTVSTPAADSIANAYKQDYGLRIGVDLSKFIRTALDENYSGFQITADYRYNKDYYIAAELGNETRTSVENTFTAETSGSYLKAGFNYNAYENWYGMQNIIYAGLRAGFSSFNSELGEYTIYTTNPYFGPDVRQGDLSFKGLNATWLEFTAGVQAELFANFYLGINLQIKRLITEKSPDGFGNLYIPGFNKVTTASKFGTGYGYTLTYLIPIYKK